MGRSEKVNTINENDMSMSNKNHLAQKSTQVSLQAQQKVKGQLEEILRQTVGF
jgi:hypothetical protein